MDLKSENEELKEENSRLAQNLRELEIIKAENETLKEYLKLTGKYANYETVPDYIISKDISNYSSTFVINVGKNALKGIYQKAVITCGKKKLSTYKKLLKKGTGIGRGMRIEAK